MSCWASPCSISGSTLRDLSWTLDMGSISLSPPFAEGIVMLALIVGAGFGVALLPALRAYKMSLADGMTVRV